MKRISYKLKFDVNYGTDEAPDFRPEISDSLYVDTTDENFAEVLESVKKQSYNGEYTVEEIPDPPHEPDVWDEMAGAYQRGVQRA